MESAFREKVLYIQERVTQAAHNAEHNAATNIHGVRQEVLPNYYKAVEIDIRVVDNPCREPTAEVDVRPEDAFALNEHMSQMGLPAEVVKTTEKKY